MKTARPDGPSLEQYVETRLNLLTAAIEAQATGFAHALAAMKAILDADKLATDLRYQQRFEAQSDALSAAFLSQQTAMQTAFVVAEKAVQAALAAADRAVSKAELAADKRFESVNEFRQTLTDQQQTFMPRLEASALFGALTDKLATMKEAADRVMNERVGLKGGWGYAVGVVGLVLTIVSILVIVFKVVGP